MNNGRLRVAWDNSIAGRDGAGTGRYASRLVSELKGHPELWLEVITGPRRHVARHGLLGLARTFNDLFWYHSSLPYSLRKQGYHLFHSPAFVAPLWCPVPSVVTILDLTSRIFPDHFDPKWRTYVNSLLPRVLRSASAVICISEHTKLDLLRFYKVSSSKIHVIHNGVDHAQFHPGAGLDPNWSRQIGLREGYMLHVGTLSYRKNIPTLLRAIAHLRSRRSWGNRQLLLAGSGNSGMKGGDDVHRIIRELQLENIVVLAGYVPDEQVPGLYAHAAVVVMPSLYEGFGFPVLEGMAAGTPVVASNVSSLPEIAGDAAVLFPPHDEHALADAIEEILKNESLAAEMRKKGVARAAQFTWQHTAEETVKVYRSVAGA
jgi:glycosyltransferase involved in cell wall biosynthesis